MVRKKNPPVFPSCAIVVRIGAEEQHEICGIFDGAATDVSTGMVTPLEIAPTRPETRSTSTRNFAASTPTLGWP